MQIDRDITKISGPLMDQIDLHIEVPAVPFQELAGPAAGTSSAAIRQLADRSGETLRKWLKLAGY